MVPVLGDFTGAALSVWMIYEAMWTGGKLPSAALSKMLWNVSVDATVRDLLIIIGVNVE